VLWTWKRESRIVRVETVVLRNVMIQCLILKNLKVHEYLDFHLPVFHLSETWAMFFCCFPWLNFCSFDHGIDCCQIGGGVVWGLCYSAPIGQSHFAAHPE
jgi:hypothetical protein